ncbi:MAG TPA: barstar family protein [Clostridia bacterium]|nr:barstar family protein [Clostridia bacterium]
MNKVYLDGRKMDNPAQAHSYLQESMDFAGYYGENLDSLWDELTSIGSPITVKLLYKGEMLENLGDYGKKLLDTFREASEENPHLVLKERNWRFF